MTLLREEITKLTAFAPATSANLGVGFDILGLAIANIGDKVTLTKRQDGRLVIDEIKSVARLPLDVNKNTASYALQGMCAELGISCGFSISIDKGIAISSGMGGSAASAVAAVVALNGFLLKPLAKEELVKYALYGEELASGARHADNVAPCVFGGVTLIRSHTPIDLISLPVPSDLYCVVIHPHLAVSTKEARALLKPEVEFKQYVRQTAQLGGVICSFYRCDLELMKRSMQDLIIEPQRSQLIPGYYAVKQAGVVAGAVAVCLSGSGPSMLALCDGRIGAEKVASAMLASFSKHRVAADKYISTIDNVGAYVMMPESEQGNGA